jgi:hypothetical protein
MVGVVTVDDDQAGKRGGGDGEAPAKKGAKAPRAAKPAKGATEKSAAPKKKAARTPRAKKAD